MWQTFSIVLSLVLINYVKADSLKCKADIAFVVDSSSSIHEDDFNTQKQFIRDVVSKFEIGPNDVQISALSYSRRVDIEFGFKTYKDKAGVLSGVDKIKYSAGTATRTYKAIEKMRDDLFARGNGVRDDAFHVGVVLTDGTTNPGSVERWSAKRGRQETVKEAGLTKKEGTFLFAVGIGRSVDRTELQDIASDPDDKFVITVNNYNELNSDYIKNLLIYRACTAPTTRAPPVTTIAPTTTSERPQKEEPEEVCQGKAADVIFVLDESTSIHNRTNFRKELNFASSTIKYFDLSPGKTQIGVIAFATDARMIFPLNKYSDKTEIQKAVMRINMKGGSTYTEKALEMLMNEGFSPKNGARSGIAQIAIIITDGNPTDPFAAGAMSEKVHAKGISVFAIGIGDVSMSELKRLASDPNSKYVFSVDNLGALDTIKKDLAYSTCKQPADRPDPEELCRHQLADIVIVADSSTSIGQKNFTRQMEFISDLVETFDIGKDATQVGLITFSTNPKIQFNMNDYSNKKDLQNALTKVPWLHGDTYTDKALRTMLYQGFSSGAGARGRKAPMIGIVITDGSSTNPMATRKMAETVQKKGITMFSIGVGRSIAKDELNTIASDPDDKYSFMVEDYASLDSIRSKLATVTCSSVQEKRKHGRSMSAKNWERELDEVESLLDILRREE